MATCVNGTVAFIDLLGFGQHIKEHTDKENMARVESYAKAVEEATTRVVLPPEEGGRSEAQRICLSYAIFSDSIVIYERSRPDKFEEAFTPGEAQWGAFKPVLKACSRLSFLLLRIGQPFTGCITQGTYYVHYDPQRGGVIVAGKPVLEAVNWQEKQGWIGIVVRPENLVKQRLDDAFADPQRMGSRDLRMARHEKWPIMVERAYTVPIRENKCTHTYTEECHYAVVPTRKDDASPSQLLESVREARNALLPMKRDAPKDVQAKYGATLSWYAELESNLGRANSALP